MSAINETARLGNITSVSCRRSASCRMTLNCRVALCCFFAVLSVLMFFCLPDRAVRAANQTGIVTASLLNVRTGAGTSYDILKQDGTLVQLENGTKVTILSSDGGWHKVSFTFGGKKLEGYVSADYIAVEVDATSLPKPASTPSPSPAAYRTVTTYKDIKVPATLLKKTPVYKKAGGKQLVVSGKKVFLSKKAAVTIVGEKTKNDKKWFYISFKYNKKTQKGYVKNSCVKMTLKNKAYAVINKDRLISSKAAPGAAYLKINKKNVKLLKNTAVNIGKDKKVGTVKWYRIYFTHNGKQANGFIRAKYVSLAKKKVVKKEPVLALSEKDFEKMLKSEGFPDSYKQSLRALHAAYPYWQFKAFHTGVTWDAALKAECELGVNLISNSKGQAWKSMEEGAYDSETGTWKVFDGSTWVAASKAAIAYYMDPRNFLNERNIFQFELLEYQSQYQTKDGINSIIQNTPFYKKNLTYKDLTTGKQATMKYVTAFVHAAKESGVSPYHLASRVKQEVVTSATTTSLAVTGTNETYPGIYNFYNIGATSGKNPAVRGLKWASTGTTYLRPWTDPYRSIVGGAMYIGTSYISKGQNTGYLQKFNVTSYQRYAHQYMTNVEAAYSEAIKTKQAYAESMDKTPIIFSIPVYEKMPASKCPAPQ